MIDNIILGFAGMVLAILTSALGRVVADDIKAWSPKLVDWLIRTAVRRLPEDERERYDEEWRYHVSDVPGEIGKVYVAGGCVFAAGAIAPNRSWSISFIIDPLKETEVFNGLPFEIIALLCWICGFSLLAIGFFWLGVIVTVAFVWGELYLLRHPRTQSYDKYDDASQGDTPQSAAREFGLHVVPTSLEVPAPIEGERDAELSHPELGTQSIEVCEGSPPLTPSGNL